MVAAVCNSARQCYDAGGFTTSVSGNLMIAQVQLADVDRPGGGPAAHPGTPRRDRRDLRRLRPDAGPARRRLPRPRGARPAHARRAHGGDPPDRGHARRHGRQRRQHHGRDAGALDRGLDRRPGAAAHPLQPRRPPPGAGPGHLAARCHRRRGGARRHGQRLPLRRGRSLPRRDAQQGHHERHLRRRAGHRQRHPRRRGGRARLRRAPRPLHEPDELGGDGRRVAGRLHRDAAARRASWAARRRSIRRRAPA